MQKFKLVFNCYDPAKPCPTGPAILASYFQEELNFEVRGRAAAEHIVRAILDYDAKLCKENSTDVGLPMPNNGIIEDIFFYEVKGDTLIQCEFTDGEKFNWEV